MFIMPAILEKDAQGFVSTFNKLSPYYNYFQIDIADGRFVPNTTLQIEDVISVVEKWSNGTTSNVAKSMKQSSFDFHLMVKDYKTEIEKIEKLKKIIKVNYILLHHSVNPNIEYLISNIKDFSFGLVLNPKDSVQEITTKYDLNKISFIQLMTVNPGFQGAPFMPNQLKKIEQLRRLDYRNKISLDGGLNAETIPFILKQKYQPEILGIGSYLTKAEDMKERVKKLNQIIKTGPLA